MRKFNNFQKQASAEWLLNISQGIILGGAGTLFIPGIGERFGIYVIPTTFLGLMLYFVAMYIGQGVKNND